VRQQREEDAWGDMGRYGEIWGDMGRYGEIWGREEDAWCQPTREEAEEEGCEGEARRRSEEGAEALR